MALDKATVGGKYSGLIERVVAPGDRAGYGDFRDYGIYRSTDYMGHRGLAAGYWVYVWPWWYVWREQRPDTVK